jgi:DNA/RNA endonuclease YhcR with UshA esterase domain
MRTITFRLLLLLSLVAAAFSACEKEFDQPPYEDLPNITANTTISEILARHTIGQPDQLIDDSLVISGIVIADDRSGNFYEKLVIQDETGGIELRLNASDLYNNYPIGRRVYVRLKGLYVGDYSGSIQINGSPDNPIESARIPDHVIGGARNQPLPVRVKRISEITPADVNTLIQFDSVEFSLSALDTTYADAIGKQSVNLTIRDCDGGQIALRTSGYADFAGVRTAQGRGPLTAVLGVYSNDATFLSTEYQLAIRNLQDVPLYGPRCNAGGAGGTGIRAVRNQFAGAATTVGGVPTIRGIVISDRAGANLVSANLIIQDSTAGIVVRFTASHSFDLGDELIIDVDGMALEEYAGQMQINNVPLANASRVSTGNSVAPRVATVDDINTNQELWESTLVQIAGSAITGGATFAGTRNINDGTGNLDLYTRATAAFAGTAVPTGTVTVTAIVSEFNGTPQVLLRNANDVGGGGGGGGGGGNATLEDISTIRDFYAGTTLSIGQNFKIRGVVTSDRAAANITTRNLFVQDASAALAVRFAADHQFNLGDEIEITVQGVELSTFGGLLQLNNAPNANATLIGPGTLPTPIVTTIADMVANAATLQGQLVTIQGVTITPAAGTTVFSGTATIADATGASTLYTRPQANFSANTVPAAPVQLTGHISSFNNVPQIVMRNASDVQ